MTKGNQMAKMANSRLKIDLSRYTSPSADFLVESAAVPVVHLAHLVLSVLVQVLEKHNKANQKRNTE